MKKTGKLNVYDAAIKRIEIAFRDFDNVLVAFSCGKDSGVLLNLTYEYAKENNLLHKLAFYYQDYEAGYKYTYQYAERVFTELDIDRKYWLCLPHSAACSVSMYEPRWIPWDEQKKDIWVREMPKLDIDRKYWLCLPHSAACSVSMYEPRWIPWDEQKKDIWVREMPKLDCVVNMDNVPYNFIKGTKGFDARIQFAEWFSSKYGTTAVFVGLRADESLSRLAIFTSKHRSKMHKNYTFTKKVNDITCNFYPIYDWETSDIWVANHKFNWDYNKIYDLYYQAGLTIHQMRVASPFHQCGQNDLKLYRVIDPNNWGKMVGRVNGCNFGGIYDGTIVTGKPA